MHLSSFKAQKIFIIVILFFTFSKNSNGQLKGQIDSIKVNGISIDKVRPTSIYRYSNEFNNDTSLQFWKDYKELKILNNGALTKYWMATQIHIPKSLLNTSLYLSMGHNNTTKIYLNNRLTYNLDSMKKKGYDLSILKNKIPLTFSKQDNIIVYKVENPDSKAIRKVLIDNNVVMPHFKYMLKLNSDSQDEKTSIAIGVFVITVAILYLLLYVLGSFEKKYLFGTVFTLSFGMVFVFGNVSDLGTVYSFFSFTFLNLLCPIALVLFVYSFFQYKLSKGVTIYLVLLTAMTFFFSIFTFIIRGSSNKIGSILLLGMIFLILISCLIFTFIALFKAVKEKKPNAKLILIGGFTLIVFTLAILCWLVFSDSPDLAGSNYSKILIMIPLPLIIMIAVVRDYILSNKKVVTQLEEIEGLTALTLKEQEEKRLILSKQNERLEKEVNERTADIKRQKHLLEEKQKEIIDSISYAKRLQDAILPPQEFVDSHIKDNFIYYKPKDIVAGDFYWAEKVDDLFFIAAADSTGHGVPGALVSVVCSNALNRTLKEFGLTDTGKILDKTRELVIDTFAKSNTEVKDGMDISLLCIDKQNQKIFWSGANNPLWFVQDNELNEIKADKQPIGKTDNPKPFTTHQLEYKVNTTFYLFTDGLADQFGGPKGKKFKYKQFEDLLIAINDEAMQEQSTIINEKFEAWKNELEQVDDVCVIGIKI